MGKYFTKQKPALLFFIILSACYSLLSVQVAFLLGKIINALMDKSLPAVYQSIIVQAVIVLLLWTICNYAKNLLKAHLLMRIMKECKRDVFDAIMSMDLQNFTSKTTGYYLTIFENDLHILRESYVAMILAVSESVMLLLISSFSLLKMNFILVLIAFLTTFIPMGIPKIFGSRLSKMRERVAGFSEAHNNYVKQSVLGIETIKSYRIENQTMDIYNQKNYAMRHAQSSVSIMQGAVNVLSYLSGYTMYIATLLAGVLLANRGYISVGMILVASQLTNNIKNPILSIIMSINAVQSTASTRTRLETLFSESKNRSFTGQKNSASDKTALKNDFEQILFKNVSYSYNGKTKALDDVSLCFQKGKKYLIVGESGSGKSTILKISMAFDADFRGDILYNDVSLRDMDISDWYRKVALVGQNVFLFEDSLRENIILGADYSNERLNDCVIKSKLNIQLFENGLDSILSEGGKNISGGERQRIAIARALVRDSEILLLDEAMSALDAQNAFEIEELILSLENKTTIAVAHQLKSDLLPRYDEILVMKEGRLVERGNFESLMREEGHFYNLYCQQIQEATDE